MSDERSCTLCRSALLERSARTASKAGSNVDVLLCTRCRCFVPDYFAEWAGADVTQAQVEFHEDWWRASTPDEMRQASDDLLVLVDDLSDAFDAVGSAELVLEVGAGRGSLVDALRRRGHRVLACEPAPELAALGHRHYGLSPEELRVEGVDELLEEVRRRGESPACVVFWHVLEHLEDPVGVLLAVNRLLPAGGRVAYQVPLLYVPYVYPEHRLFMTEQTPAVLAQATGFTVSRQETYGSDLFMTVVMEKVTEPAAPEWEDPHGGQPVPDAVGRALSFRDEVLEQRAQVISAQAELVDERGRTIDEMSAMIAARDTAIEAQARLVDERWDAVQSMGEEIARRDESLLQSQAELEERTTELKTLSQELEDSRAAQLSARRRAELAEASLERVLGHPAVRASRRVVRAGRRAGLMR